MRTRPLLLEQIAAPLSTLQMAANAGKVSLRILRANVLQPPSALANTDTRQRLGIAFEAVATARVKTPLTRMDI